MNIETAQLVVPLMDFISKWSMFGCHEKSAALTYLKNAGLEPHELAAVTEFLTALDDDPVEEEDD